MTTRPEQIISMYRIPNGPQKSAIHCCLQNLSVDESARGAHISELFHPMTFKMQTFNCTIHYLRAFSVSLKLRARETVYLCTVPDYYCYPV
jgi:hypothetical protein